MGHTGALPCNPGETGRRTQAVRGAQGVTATARPQGHAAGRGKDILEGEGKVLRHGWGGSKVRQWMQRRTIPPLKLPPSAETTSGDGAG